MKHNYWICTLLLIIPRPPLATAEALNSMALTASHLTADADLARYATYDAVSENVRALGQRMTQAIDQLAARDHIRLPAPMTDSDRRLVNRLEHLQGDEFDLAYGSMIQAQTQSESDHP